MIRLLALCCPFLLLGCQLLPQQSAETKPVTDSPAPAKLQLCIVPDSLEIWSETCDIKPWINYWIAASQLDWKTRKAMISELDPAGSDRDSLAALLLSNVNGTPYQPRLRAQRYARKLMENQTREIAHFVRFIVFEPAQRKLELESAITTLSRINAENDRELKAQQDTIEQQALQIEKILQIEKSIVDQPLADKP